MQDKGSMILRLLLNRYHAGAPDSVLKGLTEEEASKVLDVNISSNEVRPALVQCAQSLKRVHYSWLIPQFQELPKTKRSLVLALLPEASAAKMRQATNEASTPLQLSKPMQAFFCGQLSSLLPFDAALPVEYLPQTDLTFVATLNKTELVKLIDLLGLYDLADEIHQIVDRTILEKIYGCLTPTWHHFLKGCLRQREKLVGQRLQLKNWDGDSSKLKRLLHHRGIVRLGYALSGQHPDLLWHITHILDKGRGEKLARHTNKEAIPGVTKALKKQVQQAVDFLKKKDECE